MGFSLKIAQQIHHNKPPSSSKHTFSTLGQKTCQGRRRVFMFSWMRSMLRLKLRSERNSAGFFCCDPQTWMFPSWIFTCLKRWNFKAWKNLENLWKLGGMAKQKTISAFVSCWTQTFGLLDIEHFRTWIDWGYHYLCRSNNPQAVTLTDVPIKQQKRASDIISSMKSKLSWIMATPDGSINFHLSPLQTFNLQNRLSFSDEHPWGSEPFLGNLLVSKESYCCLVDHGDQDQSPTPHPSETAKKTPAGTRWSPPAELAPLESSSQERPHH